MAADRGEEHNSRPRVSDRLSVLYPAHVRYLVEKEVVAVDQKRVRRVIRNSRGDGSVRNAPLLPNGSAPAQLEFGSLQWQLSHHMTFSADSITDVRPKRTYCAYRSGTSKASEIVRRRTLSRLSNASKVCQ